jgi:hypothetical protein
MLSGLLFRYKSAFYSLAIVLIYIVTGKLGLMLAVPPGYA